MTVELLLDFGPETSAVSGPVAACIPATAGRQPVAHPQSAGFVNPPFNYTGSKHRLLDQLIPLFDRTKPNFIDMFAGGGAVYANVLDLYQSVLANDIINDLIGAHQALIARSAEFVAEVKALCVAKDDQAGFHKLRAAYNANKTPAALYALMLCSTNNMMRFNRRFDYNQTFGKRTFNASTQAKIDAWVAHLQPRAAKLRFSSQSFTAIWPAEPSATFWYLDPPYSATEAGYNAYWDDAQERRLYDYILRIHESGGTFALSGLAGAHGNSEESWLIRQLTEDGFNVTALDADYEKVARLKGKDSTEVLIRNYSCAT